MTQEEEDAGVNYTPLLSEDEFKAAMEKSVIRNKAIDKIASAVGLSQEELDSLGLYKTRIKEWPLGKKRSDSAEPKKKL